ncbi:MAG: sigma-70 family RNA polymerase sigma factor [Actinomycetota bacterium]|nr:sigma-70 family RNA polymerase sigma factor [Actinomycetota bacterium]
MTGGREFDEFFLREHPRVVALATALTGVPEVARDLAQESLLKAYRAWSAVSQMERPGAWVRRVTINDAMSWHRRNGREAKAVRRLGRPSVVEQPEHEGPRFWAAVRALPERQRAAVTLYYLDDQSVATVAAVLGVPEGTVKTSLFRARATLATVLGTSTDDPISGGA